MGVGVVCMGVGGCVCTCVCVCVVYVLCACAHACVRDVYECTNKFVFMLVVLCVWCVVCVVCGVWCVVCGVGECSLYYTEKLMHSCRNMQLANTTLVKQVGSSSWGSTPTSFLTRNTCFKSLNLPVV